MEPTFVAPTAVYEKYPCCQVPARTTRSLNTNSPLIILTTPGFTESNSPTNEITIVSVSKDLTNEDCVGIIVVTWKVSPDVHGPLGRGVKAVVVSRCQIKHNLIDLRPGVLLGNLLLSQEAPCTVRDSFHLLHHALLEGSKVKDLAINRAHLNIQLKFTNQPPVRR